jgi:TolB-like protein/DNA-binding winged helix-turn-helix (wHTH) protein
MSSLGPFEIFLFEDFRLDRRGLFRREEGGAVVPAKIGSRALDILRILVERAGELVTKDEIVAAIWPGMVVEDSNLTVQISTLRRILDKEPAEASCIQTVSRRGYRFVATVTRLQPLGATESASKAVAGGLDLAFPNLGEQQVKNIARPFYVERIALERTASPALPPLPEKPSIAVLPFQNLSGDPEQEYFVDGMVQEIITALSRIRWLFVIARNSSFTYKDQAVDVKQVGRELGVRYVLEGSVRKAGGRVRITAQLIEATTGAHIWADRFDGSLDDVFDLQDKVASSVAGVIEPALQAAETASSAARPTDDLTAYDLYLRAYAMFLSSARQIPEALRLLERAITRDPRYGPALAFAAVCCFRLLYDDRSEDWEADHLKGADFARRALEVAGDDPGVLANAALALAYFGEDIGAMVTLVDHALALNSNYARGWHIGGLLRIWAGEPNSAIEHLEAALRLSPRARIGLSHTDLGSAHFYSRRFNEAEPKLLLAIQEDPSFPLPYRILAACYAHMGRCDDARETVERLRAITRVVIPDRISYLRNAEHRELLLSGLRLAMGEAA